MISSEIQNELIEFIPTIDNLDVTNVVKYDGQLSVDDINEVALNMPAILVFYNGSEFSPVAEGNNKYNRNSLVQLLVCSDNIATQDSKNDEALDIKDRLIDGITGTQLTTVVNAVSSKYNIVVVDDRVVIRDKILTVVSVTVMVSGLDQ